MFGCRQTGLAMTVALATSVAWAERFNRNTDWMTGKVGVFQHYLYHTTDAAAGGSTAAFRGRASPMRTSAPTKSM